MPARRPGLVPVERSRLPAPGVERPGLVPVERSRPPDHILERPPSPMFGSDSSFDFDFFDDSDSGSPSCGHEHDCDSGMGFAETLLNLGLRAATALDAAQRRRAREEEAAEGRRRQERMEQRLREMQLENERLKLESEMKNRQQAAEQRREEEKLKRQHEQELKEKEKKLKRQHEQESREKEERHKREMDEEKAKQAERERKTNTQWEEKRRAMEEEAKRAQNNLDEQNRKREEVERDAKLAQKLHEEKMKRMSEALNNMESQLNSGIQPIELPTSDERALAEQMLLQPRGNYIHCAVAGLRGCGKSSLINALRGLRDKHPSAARTGTCETTQEVTAYPHPTPTQALGKIVWYDVPGAGTVRHRGWQYFNRQGLFVFDVVIVMPDAGLTEKDLDILEHCQRYRIPSFLVRSKADQNITNVLNDEAADDDDDDEWDGGFSEAKVDAAREKYVRQTQQSYREAIAKVPDLNPAKMVYIVSKPGLLAKRNGRDAQLRGVQRLIHENELLDALAGEVVRIMSNREESI